GGQLEHLRAERREEDGDTAFVRNGQADLALHSLAGEGGGLVVQEREEDGQVFVHVPQRALERVAVHLLDDDLVGQADAEREAARPGRDGGRTRLLRQNGRVPRIGRHD